MPPVPLLQRCCFAIALGCASGLAGAQEAYKPLFSDEVLRAADPESRARLEALNERNRKRWQAQQRQTRASGNTPGAATTPRVAAPGGKLYRITDAQGNVRFSDQYVPGAKEVSVSVAEPSAQSRAEHDARQQEQARVLEYFDDRNRRRAAESAEAKRLDAEAADRKKRCHELFLEIQDNRRGGFVFYDVDADGERTYLSDAELKERTDGMVANYEKHCGALPATDG